MCLYQQRPLQGCGSCLSGTCLKTKSLGKGLVSSLRNSCIVCVNRTLVPPRLEQSPMPTRLPGWSVSPPHSRCSVSAGWTELSNSGPRGGWLAHHQDPCFPSPAWRLPSLG